MSNQSISIIIVTFNSEKYIETCIQTLVEYLPKKEKAQITIVDNNSKDKTTEIVNLLASEYGNIRLVINEINLGFAKAVNMGLKASSDSDYFLLLNPDTILNSSSITNLIKCVKRYNSGITGGSTFNYNGIENGSYFRLPNRMVGIYDFTNIRKLDRSDKWHKYFYYHDRKFKKEECFPVDVVTGGYMMINSETIKKIGYFDEGFFMYLEDVDYCLRAKSAGIKIYHNNNSWITHYSGGSSVNKDRIKHSAWMFSRKRYFAKNFSLIKNVVIQPIFLLDDILIMINKLFRS